MKRNKYVMVNKSVSENEKGLKIKSKRQERQSDFQENVETKVEISESIPQLIVDDEVVEVKTNSNLKKNLLSPSKS